MVKIHFKERSTDDSDQDRTVKNTIANISVNCYQTLKLYNTVNIKVDQSNLNVYCHEGTRCR